MEILRRFCGLLAVGLALCMLPVNTAQAEYNTANTIIGHGIAYAVGGPIGGIVAGDYVTRVISTGCWDDCDALSTQEANDFAKRLITGGATAQEINENKNHSYCKNCYENMKKMQSALKNYCAQNCGEGTDCQDRCERHQKNFDAWTERSEDCYIYRTKGHTSGRTAAALYTKILNAFLNFGGTGCWFCPIFDTIFSTTNILATNIYVRLRGIFLSLLALGAFGWLLWTVFKFMVTIHGPNVGELMTKLFKGLGLVMLISIAMQPTPSFITGLIVDPIALMSSGLSNDILTIRNFESTDNSTISFKQYIDGDPCKDQTTNTTRQGIIEVCQKKDRSEYEGMALSADVYNQMNCLLRRVSLELVMGLSLGCALVATGITGGALGILPQFDVLAVGILLVFAYFTLYVMVPFKLIDILLRLCFVICLLPLFLVCAAIPGTREYSKKGFQMFISCWIGLIALSLFITFAIELINAAFR